MVFTKKRYTKTVKTNIGTLTFVQGYFRAQSIRLNEVSINNKVLRITLDEQPVQTRKTFNGQNRRVSNTRKSLRQKKRESTKMQESVPISKRRTTRMASNELNRRKSSFLNGDFSNFIDLCNKSPRVYKNKMRNYCLRFEEAPPPIFPQLNFPFDTLVEAVKRMRLPAGWVVKYMVHKGVIVFVCITNNNRLKERSLTFGSGSQFYKIVVDCKTVSLLASPKTIDTIKDLEVLTNIVQDIRADDCMVNTITLL